MNVIPFRRAIRGYHDDPEVDIAYVAAALRYLGEPATVAEIADFLSLHETERTMSRSIDVATLLASHSPSGLLPSIFRPVGLGGGAAWAFTPEFRRSLRQAGLEPRFRTRGA